MDGECPPLWVVVLVLELDLAPRQVLATVLVVGQGGLRGAVRHTPLPVPQGTTTCTGMWPDGEGILDCVRDAFQKRCGEVVLCPRRKIQRHQISAKKRAPVIDDCPRNTRAHLFRVGLPDGETLLPI